MAIRRKESITVSKDDVIKAVVPVFTLHEADFLRLTKIHSITAIWAHSFFAGTGVFAVTLAAKFVNHQWFGGFDCVTRLEWITLGILGVLVLIFELIHFCLPSEKKKALKRISQFFEVST